jgi:predicted transcriptional regulator
VSFGKFRSKVDLMLKIKQTRMLLNGRHRDGSKATYASDFKFTRYAIVLLAAISISNFEYHTKKIKNTTFISYYNLYKVARFLGIEFERTKAAPYVYKELIERGQVKLAIENNRTFITFTEKGKKSCEEKLEELQDLNEQFNSSPSKQQKYREGESWSGKSVKGVKPRPRQQVGIETEIDKLIKKISRW